MWLSFQASEKEKNMITNGQLSKTTRGVWGKDFIIPCLKININFTQWALNNIEFG